MLLRSGQQLAIFGGGDRSGGKRQNNEGACGGSATRVAKGENHRANLLLVGRAVLVEEGQHADQHVVAIDKVVFDRGRGV